MSAEGDTTTGEDNAEEVKKKGGKQSLYDPKRGSGNHLAAELGRFSDNPVFLAIRSIAGVAEALRSLEARTQKRKFPVKEIKLRLKATEGQMTRAWTILSDEAQKVETWGDKMRFAEAIASFFSHSVSSDERTERVCWMAIQMRTRLHSKPSRAELRREVKDRYKYEFTDKEWTRLLKRTGLDIELPTARQKKQMDEDTLRKD